MRSFLGIEFAPWQGNPSARPLSMCGADAVAIPITVSWSVYGVGNAKPNFAVTIGMNATGQRTLADNIKSIYIDNLGVNVPIYVHFPSTGFVVAAKPNSANWYPVFTNDQVAVIVGEGFTNADTNAVTNIYFANVLMMPYSNDEISQSVMLGRSSTDISRGGNFSNSFFGAVALGDQSQGSSLTLNPSGSIIAFKPGPGPGGRQLSGFYYITNIFVSIPLSATSAGDVTSQILLRDTDSGATILSAIYTAPCKNAIIYTADGFNEKLDATHLWEWVNPGAAGILSGTAAMHIRYTYQQS